jgi:transcriptional regulator with XRE-family HTH domain
MSLQVLLHQILPQNSKKLGTVWHRFPQIRLAELLAISPRVYSRCEGGEVTPHFDTIVRLADILGVTLDELAGRKDVQSSATIKNPELSRLYKKVDHLSDEDQKALVIVLDSLMKRSKVSKVMAEL